MELEKTYVEYHAKLHVETALKLGCCYFAKSERPDFVSRRHEVGMEVTRAVIQQWAQQEADMNRVFGDEMPGEAVEQTILADCANDATAGKTGNPLERKLFLELSPEVKAAHIARIIERITEKTKLLPEYQPCQQQWLYVYSETIGLSREDLRQVQAFFLAQTQELLYERIFIKVGCILYILRRGETMGEITLSSRQLLRLHKRARRITFWFSHIKQ